jgi:glycosyltransferase involved in cell wall biosynthesis
LRILFVAPAYWPALAFGGPISKLRELAQGLAERGHTVDVVTTSLVDLRERPPSSTRREVVDGAEVHYLGTPWRYRWMGIAPSTRRELDRLPRPDVLHVFGFRDFVGTVATRWARRGGVPYVFEGLGMVRPKLRKVALKRGLDATVYRSVLAGATLLVAASAREREEYLGAGARPERVEIRPNGFPAVKDVPATGLLRSRVGLDSSAPLVLSVGRVARGKGLDLLVRSLSSLPGVHAAIVGPDDGHGMTAELTGLSASLGVADRVHLLGPVARDELPGVYVDADVVVLASAHESFGMSAAEAAALGVPVVVSDRCGIAELLRDGGGEVVGYDADELRGALQRVLADQPLREALGEGGRTVAAKWSWGHVVELQEQLYEKALHRG